MYAIFYPPVIIWILFHKNPLALFLISLLQEVLFLKYQLKLFKFKKSKKTIYPSSGPNKRFFRFFWERLQANFAEKDSLLHCLASGNTLQQVQ